MKFTVVRRGASPAIDASGWGVEQVGGNVYIVTGRTQPGLVVSSQGTRTFAANDGSFRLQVNTPLSELPVELMDDRGNRAGFVISVHGARVLRKF